MKWGSESTAQSRKEAFKSRQTIPRSRNCLSCVPRWPLQVYQLRHKVTASSVSVASQGDRFKCISCVPKWLLQVYQLRPAVGKELYQLRPGLSTPGVTSCVPRLVRNYTIIQLRPKLSISCILLVSRVDNRTRMSCIERYEYSKCPTIWRFLHSFIVPYFIRSYMYTYRMISTMHRCIMLLLMFKRYWKKSLLGVMKGTLCS